MKVYFAPLEGVTDEIYRRTHHELFSGIDKYFIPFISPAEHFTFNSRVQKSIDPEENMGIPAVPQVLTANAAHFVRMTQILRDFGYREVNLNAGCPSGTVTAKGKGAGMLKDREHLRRFLDTVFEKATLPVSVKTRIGYESADEWAELLEIYKDYPMLELIVHMRTREEFYRGAPHTALTAPTLQKLSAPFVYNGDLFLESECAEYLKAYPQTSALMLGRGLIANPAMGRALRGGERIRREEILLFHERLFERYMAAWPKNAVVGHMCEMMTYVCCLFEGARRMLKTLRKCKTPEQYEKEAARMLSEAEMRADPGFDLMILKA